VTDGTPAGSLDLRFWHGRRVLITGHTGFKGSWLTLWLQALGSQVSGLAAGVPTRPSLFELTGVGERLAEDIRADIRDPTAVDRAVGRVDPEIVIHMAAQPLVRLSFQSPRETFATNVMGTANVLDAVRRAPSTRVVVNVTSDKAYENRGWEWGYREDDRLGGHDPYSASKGAAEIVAAAYRRSFFSNPDGPQLASARAGNVIGGGDWGAERLVSDVARAVIAQDTLRIRNPASIRPWQHVLNPLSGYLLLAQELWSDPALATAWNFGPPESDAVSVRDLVEGLRNRWTGRPDWDVDAGPHPHEAHYLKLDSSRARDRLGWRPLVPLPVALDSIVEWFDALIDGADMAAVTTGQIARLTAAVTEPPT
jgi:CDP-glucose 4,6-dehydratase